MSLLDPWGKTENPQRPENAFNDVQNKHKPFDTVDDTNPALPIL